MSLFNQLKQQLSQQLEQLTQTGFTSLQASVAVNAKEQQSEDLTLLAWLKAQKEYPQFFWTPREKTQTFASVGAVKTFTDLDAAQKWVEQTGLTLVGGLQFEGACHFILPRLLLVKKASKLTAYLFLLDAENSKEREAALQALNHFGEQTELNLADNQWLSTQSACDFAKWQHNIEQALALIQAQHFLKVVLANAITQTFTHSISAYDLLAKSQQINQGCYHFLWAESSAKTFIGSSPERLYQRNHQTFLTEALAGTVAVSDSLAETERNALWLLNDEKNSYENQLVVEDIKSHLSDSIEHFEVGEVEIKRLKNVQHLRRPIQITLKPNVKESDCLVRIHPTAAVAGLPRSVAKQFIHQHEPFKRHWYAGTLGFFNQNEAEFCVTLRSAEIAHNQITFFAGAGIVQGSIPDAEWQEIERKALGLASLLKK